jgi:predicted metal-dependent hydrolase
MDLVNKLLRYMVYLKNEKYNPNDATSILSLSRNILHDDKIIIRDVRVASHFLELDISIATSAGIEKIKSKLSQIAPIIDIDRIIEKELDKRECLELARELFNNEKYWKTHEVLEGIWKHTQGDERDLLNGIILIAAALVHYQKAELAICISIMKRALVKLNNSYGKYYDVDIDSLKREVTNMLKSSKVSNFRI